MSLMALPFNMAPLKVMVCFLEAIGGMEKAF